MLTPLAVDPSHPFPYISNLALSIAAMVADPDPKSDDRRFARVKVPTVFPRLVEVDESRFIPVEDVMLAHLHTLFAGMVIEEAATFRVTRNADLTLEDEEAEDLLEALEMELRRRRFNKAVRLEVSESMSDEMLDLLVSELEMTQPDVYRCRAPIDLGYLWQLHGVDRPDLKDRAWPPVTAGRIATAEETDRPLVSVMRDRAIFVHHPYESFTSSTEAFIEQAAHDHRVQSIKMTLYRAGGDSPIIRSLIRAAERGVQVAVLVELKARFDEATNVNWAKELERAGVHVVYGMVGLKTHSKCVLIVATTEISCAATATSGPATTTPGPPGCTRTSGSSRVTRTSGPTPPSCSTTSPATARTSSTRRCWWRRVTCDRAAPADRARGEVRYGGSHHAEGELDHRHGLIEALYLASQAGVRVEMVVRGISSLRAGVDGLSDNISVRSILGRYLEHSRIYRFAHGDVDDQPLYLIGSADLMPRNLNRRVEVLVPIDHPKHREWLDRVFEFLLADDIVRWELQADDTWARCGPLDAFEPHAQERLYRWVVERQAAKRGRKPLLHDRLGARSPSVHTGSGPWSSALPTVRDRRTPQHEWSSTA